MYLWLRALFHNNIYSSIYHLRIERSLRDLLTWGRGHVLCTGLTVYQLVLIVRSASSWSFDSDYVLFN